MENLNLNQSQLLKELERLKNENLELKNRHDLVQMELSERAENIVELSLIIQNSVQQRMLIEDDLLRHNNILISVAEIAQNFLLARGWQELVEISLQQLVQSAGVSRAYLFKNKSDTDVWVSESFFEKCAENISVKIDHKDCQNINWLDAGLRHWFDLLSTGNELLRKKSDYSIKESEMLMPQNVLSVLLVPLFIKGKFWGFMGFDDCLEERYWSQAEIAALKSAAIVIGAAIEREQFDLSLREKEEKRIRHAEKQRDDLTREVHHRIKNHLQGLMGLLKQRKKTSVGINVVIDDAVSQIESIAVVYGLQARNEKSKIFFSEMIGAIIDSFENTSTLPLILNFEHEMESCEVDSSKAVALALAVNEIIVNAIKHANHDTKNGKIEIHHEHRLDKIILSITNPGRLPDGFDFQAQKGLGTGLELIQSMLPSKGAELIFDECDYMVSVKLLISSPLLLDV